jgi:hypothetical protein
VETCQAILVEPKQDTASAYGDITTGYWFANFHKEFVSFEEAHPRDVTSYMLLCVNDSPVVISFVTVLGVYPNLLGTVQ